MLKPSNVNPFFVDKPHFFGIESPQSHFGRWNLHDILIYRWCIPFECWSNPHFLLLKSNSILAANKSQVELRLAVLLPAIHGLNPIESHQNLQNKYLQGVVNFDMFDAQIWSSQSCKVGTPSFPNCLIYRYTPLTFINCYYIPPNQPKRSPS